MRELRRSIRIKWFFRDKPENPYYIPRFHVKNSEWDPPTAPDIIEEAMIKMEKALVKQASSLPQSMFLLNPDIKSLRDFLQDGQFLVKITDKNLGLAVITKDWYSKECELHLSNKKAYTLVSPEAILGLDRKLFDIIKGNVFTPTIKKFLLQSMIADLPRFYVIPKIHKTPWASRPIIPSHSWVTSRASEVVDYFLQPLLSQYNFVLNRTKAFLTGLRSAVSKTDSLHNCILVSGDVRAMYTNIDPDEAIHRVGGLLKDCNLKGNSCEGIFELLKFILQNNFFGYERRIYKQKSLRKFGTKKHR